MRAVSRILRDRALTTADYLDTLNREWSPLLQAVRELVNRLAAAPEQLATNSGSTETLDWSAYHYRAITLTANCTLTFVLPTGAAELVLRVIQDATGARTITWPNTVYWEGSSAPTLTAGGGSIDLIRLYCDGTNYYGSAVLDLQL